MSDTQTACSHSRVVLKHNDYPDGTRSDYWECDSGCGKRFYPDTFNSAQHNRRVWLAGKALSGVLSNPDFIIRVLNYDNPVRPSDNSQKLFDEAAALAVRAADATLKELNKA